MLKQQAQKLRAKALQKFGQLSSQIPQTQKTSGSIGILGFLNVLLVGCSVFNLFKIFEFKGCAACDSNLDDIGQKSKLRSIFWIALTTLVISVALLMSTIFISNSPDLLNKLEKVALASGIFSFILLLFDSVVFGMLQYDKTLATIRETGAYGNFKISMGISIGVRAFVFIGLMIMFGVYKKKETTIQPITIQSLPIKVQ